MKPTIGLLYKGDLFMLNGKIYRVGSLIENTNGYVACVDIHTHKVKRFYIDTSVEYLQGENGRMTCNNKCIHYPVCEQKNFDFANIEDCPHYLDLLKEIRTIKVPTYPDGEEYCIRCIPADVINEYIRGGDK